VFVMNTNNFVCPLLSFYWWENWSYNWKVKHILSQCLLTSRSQRTPKSHNFIHWPWKCTSTWHFKFLNQVCSNLNIVTLLTLCKYSNWVFFVLFCYFNILLRACGKITSTVHLDLLPLPFMYILKSDMVGKSFYELI